MKHTVILVSLVMMLCIDQDGLPSYDEAIRITERDELETRIRIEESERTHESTLSPPSHIHNNGEQQRMPLDRQISDKVIDVDTEYLEIYSSISKLKLLVYGFIFLISSSFFLLKIERVSSIITASVFAILIFIELVN